MNGINICIFGIFKLNVEKLCEMFCQSHDCSTYWDRSWAAHASRQILKLLETKNKTNVDWERTQPGWKTNWAARTDCVYLRNCCQPPVSRPWHPWEPRSVVWSRAAAANHHEQTSFRMFWLQTWDFCLEDLTFIFGKQLGLVMAGVSHHYRGKSS